MHYTKVRSITILLNIIIITGSAFIANLILTPLTLAFAHQQKWYDSKDSRKIHKQNIPRIGGTAITLSFVIASAIGFGRLIEAMSLTSILLIMGSLITIHALGLYDDFSNIPAQWKFLIQILATIIFMFSGITFQGIQLPWINAVLFPGWLAVICTVLWIVSLTNAFNLIDGADGLAGSIAMIAAVAWGIIALYTHNIPLSVLSFSFAGSMAAFLFFNFPPAKIFMGDSGSLFTGFIIAVLPLIHAHQTNNGIISIIPAILLVLVPIADTVFSIIRRIAARQPVYIADRQHIHHRLMDTGMSNKQLLLIMYGITVLLGICGVLYELL